MANPKTWEEVIERGRRRSEFMEYAAGLSKDELLHQVRILYTERELLMGDNDDLMATLIRMLTKESPT